MSNEKIMCAMPKKHNSDEGKIDLLQWIRILKKKILIIILVAVIGASLMGAYSIFIAAPQYSSTAKLYVLSQSTSITSFADIQLSSALANDYKEMVYSYPVVIEVINNLGLDCSYSEVCKMVSVENPANTRLINITATMDDPKGAKELANELANVSRENIAKIMSTDEPKFFEHARIEQNPVSPNIIKNILIGFIAGAILVVLIVIVRFQTNDVIRTLEDIEERLEGNLLAIIPFEKEKRGKKA